MILIKSYKAGTIFVSIIIALIIGIFCSSLIILVYYYRNLSNKEIISNKMSNNINSAIILVLDSNYNRNDSVNYIDLFDNKNDSIKIKKKEWGIFTNYEISSSVGKFEKKKIIQIGSKQEIPKYAIYQFNTNKPLTLTGKTEINGNCYLPTTTIKTTYFENSFFTGTIPNTNQIKLNDEFFPKFSDSLMLNIRNFINGVNTNSHISTLQISDNIENSFQNDRLLIYSNSKIIQKSKSIKGNIVIKSDKYIELNSNTYLQDIILIAPVVKINKGCKGSVQIFATDSILISKECVFKYPTVLYLESNKAIGNEVKIDESVKIDGYIISLNSSTDPYITSIINIQPNSIITGIVYTDKYVDLKGTVNGSITCDKFIYRTISSVYDNYIYNGTINYKKLPPFFITSGIFNSTKRNEQAIIKYLK